MEYWITAGDGGCDAVTGGVTKKQNPQQPWLNYISVESIDAAIEKGTELGAIVALPKMPIPDGGSIAVLIDPQGNPFGLVQKPAGSDGPAGSKLGGLTRARVPGR